MSQQARDDAPLDRLLWKGIDLVFPPSCAGCGKMGMRWCTDCQKNIKFIRGPICEICGKPQARAGTCTRCAYQKPGYEQLRSWSLYADPIRRALLRLKYHNDVGLGVMIAAQLACFFNELNWNVDVIVPVPLGKRRRWERGYNQAELIAKPLARTTGIAYGSKALIRNRETRSQVGLEVDERRENMLDAFSSSGQRVSGKTILLVDDIATTGSTLSACAEALKSCGAEEILALTVARA